MLYKPIDVLKQPTVFTEGHLRIRIKGTEFQSVIVNEGTCSAILAKVGPRKGTFFIHPVNTFAAKEINSRGFKKSRSEVFYTVPIRALSPKHYFMVRSPVFFNSMDEFLTPLEWQEVIRNIHSVIRKFQHRKIA